MKDEWSLYKKEQEDGANWLFRKNLHPLPEDKSKTHFPMCIYFTARYTAHTEDGFPSPEDYDAFEEVENHLVSICNGEHSVFVASVFMPELKDFIIYTNNPDKLCDQIELQVKQFGQFDFEFGGNEDKTWDQYVAIV